MSCARRSRGVLLLEVLDDRRRLEHGGSRVWIFHVGRLERSPSIFQLLPFGRAPPDRPHQVRQLQLHQLLPHELAERRRLVRVYGDGLLGHLRRRISAPRSHPWRQPETRGEHRQRPGSQQTGNLLLTRAVLVVEVVDDVVGLVHRNPGVVVDHVRKHGLAAGVLDVLPEVRSALRARVELHVEVQPHHRLAHLAAERAPLELVQLDGRRGPRELGDVGGFLEPAAAELAEGVLALGGAPLDDGWGPSLAQRAGHRARDEGPRRGEDVGELTVGDAELLRLGSLQSVHDLVGGSDGRGLQLRLGDGRGGIDGLDGHRRGVDGAERAGELGGVLVVARSGGGHARHRGARAGGAHLVGAGGDLGSREEGAASAERGHGDGGHTRLDGSRSRATGTSAGGSEAGDAPSFDATIEEKMEVARVASRSQEMYPV